MAVRADLRGQGISSLLLLAVARFALSIDCDWVVLTTGMVKKTDLRLRAFTILASPGEFTQPRAHLFDPFSIQGRAMEAALKAYLRLGFEGRELPESVAFSGNAWVLAEKHTGKALGARQMQQNDEK